MRGMAQGSRNDLGGFESQGFIESVSGNRIAFDYNGIHDALLRTVQPEDVVWACELLGRLSNQQWRDAFRAGGYTPDAASRYIAKIESKIGEGLALRSGSRE